jgi:hypothetical protein
MEYDDFDFIENEREGTEELLNFAIEKPKEMATIFENTVKDVMFEDDECNPETELFYKSMAHVKSLSSRIGQKQLRRLAEIMNELNDKYQASIKSLVYFQFELTDPEIQQFIDRYRSMCSMLKKYCENVLKSIDESQVVRAFETIEFSFSRFEDSYKTVQKLLEDREKFVNTRLNKPSKLSAFISGITGTVKWVWNWKYHIYITGLLLYNIHLYVFPVEITSGLDAVIRIAGAVCYTFASDRVSRLKYTEAVFSMFTLISNSMFSSMLGLKVPNFLKKLFTVGSTCVFYIFTYFVQDWIGYFMKLVCQGILIFGVGIHSGEHITEGVWLQFEATKTAILTHLANGIEVISELFAESSTKIVELFTKLFVNIFYEGVVLKTQSYLSEIPKRLFGSFFSSGNGDELTGLVPTIDSVENAVSLGIARTELDLPHAKEILEKVNETLVQSVIIVENGYKRVKDDTLSHFHSVLVSMGTEKLWKDLRQLSFKESLSTYIVGIIMVTSILKLIFVN